MSWNNAIIGRLSRMMNLHKRCHFRDLSHALRQCNRCRRFGLSHDHGQYDRCHSSGMSRVMMNHYDHCHFRSLSHVLRQCDHCQYGRMFVEKPMQSLPPFWFVAWPWTIRSCHYSGMSLLIQCDRCLRHGLSPVLWRCDRCQSGGMSPLIQCDRCHFPGLSNVHGNAIVTTSVECSCMTRNLCDRCHFRGLSRPKIRCGRCHRHGLSPVLWRCDRCQSGGMSQLSHRGSGLYGQFLIILQITKLIAHISKIECWYSSAAKLCGYIRHWMNWRTEEDEIDWRLLFTRDTTGVSESTTTGCVTSPLVLMQRRFRNWILLVCRNIKIEI